MSFTIGSLFDGSGGFPLAATMCGGIPKWSSEIEPYPIAVTKSRFPGIKHLGSVTDIKGGEVEPVDVITFGSPCQDLSVAGKRAGLKHEANGDDETTRSGLFMEAVRIIKEMREATNGVYPRFALWENVPGAFSRNKGEDFRIVLEELIKVVEPTAVMPPVPEKGWPYADSYCGDGWSIAYRVLDAQFWGVPQRRRRIYLVADFRGECAGKVSFEREGLRGYFETSRTPWQATAGDAENCTGATDCEGNEVNVLNPWDSQGNQVHDSTGNNVYPCLRGCGGAGYQAGYVLARTEPIIYDGSSVTSPINASNPQAGDPCHTLNTDSRNYVVQAVPYTLKIRSGCEGGGKGALIQEDMSATLATNNDQYLFQPIGIVDSIGGQAERGWEGETAPCLKASHYKFAPCVAVPVAGFCTEHSAQARGIGYEEEISPTLRAGVVPACVYSVENHPADSRVNLDESGKVQTLTSRMGTGGGNVPMVMEPQLASGGKVTGCLMASGYDKLGAQEMFSGDYTVIEKHPVYCLQGNGIDRADTAGCNGKGVKEDICYTLNTIDRPAVAYSMKTIARNGKALEEQANPICASDYKDPDIVAYSLETFHCTSEEEKTTTLKARDYKDPIMVAYGVDCRNMNETPELYPTLQAKPNGGQSLNYSGAVRVQYIVRRLTPTECARLQGFPDTWGHPTQKTELTDEEYQFWLNVRNTHAAINDKATKEYTKEQILKWYNGLHTDSSEYKMWGNGIALPNALYVMQGIADVMSEEKNARKKWLDDLLK